MSKLPFVIAQDQGLYAKRDLDVEIWMPPPEFEGGKEIYLRFWPSILVWLGHDPPSPDFLVTGELPVMVSLFQDPDEERMIALAATDCSVRAYIIGRPGIESLADLKGKRIGVNAEGSVTAFAALRMIREMGWQRGTDVFLITRAGMEKLRSGEVDAISGGDDDYEAAKREGFPILQDTRAWNEELPGNGVIVSPKWLQDETHQEAMGRFLAATAEGVALFHQRPELALDVATEWYGMDRDVAAARYLRADYVPRKPFPCIEGTRKALELFDSEESRKYQPEDFYDDSFMRELDESGFLDSLYQE